MKRTTKFLQAAGIVLATLLLPLLSAAQTYPNRVSGYHISLSGFTVSGTSNVSIGSTKIDVPWYSPYCSDCTTKEELCASAATYYEYYEPYSYYVLSGNTTRALSYPLSEISRMSLSYAVSKEIFNDMMGTCSARCGFALCEKSVTYEYHKMQSSSVGVRWELFLGGSSTAFKSGSGGTVSLTQSDRAAMSSHTAMRVVYSANYYGSTYTYLTSVELTAPLPQAKNLLYHTEYAKNSSGEWMAGSTNSINAPANSTGSSVNLSSCSTRALELEFDAEVKTTASLRVNGSTVSTTVTKKASNKLFVELTNPDFYFEFPMTLALTMNGKTYTYTIAEASAGNPIQMLSNVTFTERPYAEYNSCAAVQGALNLNGWESVSVPAAEAVQAGGYYVVQQGLAALHVTKTYGYCRSSSQPVPVPVVEAPPAPQVSFPAGASYCPSGALTVAIGNWSALQGTTVKAEKGSAGWSFGSATLSFSPGAGDVRFSATTTRGCRSEQVHTVSLYSPPQVAQQPVSQTLCEGGRFAASVQASGTGLTYRWQKDGVNISGAAAPQYVKENVSLSDAGSYHVVVSGTCGEVASKVATVDVSKNPVAPTISGNAWTCNGEPASLEQPDMEPGFRYSLEKGGQPYPVNGYYYWTIEQGQAVGNTSSRQLNLPDGEYTLYAKNSSNEACSASVPLTVAARTTSFGLSFGSSNRFCQQEEAIDLFDILSGGYAALGSNTAQWTLNEGLNGQSIPLPENRYMNTLNLSAGFYTATLVVSDGRCDTAMSAIIEIMARPESIILTADTTACNGLPVTYTANQSSLSYEWYLDGQKVDGESSYRLTRSYADNNLHSVYAIGANANGCINTAATVETEALTVHSALRFTDVLYDGCPYNFFQPIKNGLLESSSPSEYGSIASATISDGQPKYTFEGAGLSVADKDYLDLYHCEEGTHTLYLTVKESFTEHQGYCMVRSDSTEVSIHPAPPVFSISPVEEEETAGTILLCNQPELTMQVENPAANVAYLWYNGGSYVGYGSEVAHALHTDGIATYKVFAQGDYACQRESEDSIIVERRFVDFDIHFNNALTAYCNNNPTGWANLFDSTTGVNKEDIRSQTNGYSYMINSEDLSMSPDGDISIATTTLDQTYPVDLKVSKNGCSHTLSTVVTVNTTPAAAEISSSTMAPLCSGEEVTLEASAQNAGTFRWYRNGEQIAETTSGSLTETPTANAVYTVEGYNSGCGAGTQSSEVQVEVAPAPELVYEEYSGNLRMPTMLMIYTYVSDNTAAAKIILRNNLTQSTWEYDDASMLYHDGFALCISKTITAPTITPGHTYTLTIELLSANGCQTVLEYQVTANAVLPVTPTLAPLVGTKSYVAAAEQKRTEAMTVAAPSAFKASLTPTVVLSGGQVHLSVQAAAEGRTFVRMLNAAGSIMHQQRVNLQEGYNELDLTAARIQKGWFLVHIAYSDGTSEVLKGLSQ